MDSGTPHPPGRTSRPGDLPREGGGDFLTSPLAGEVATQRSGAARGGEPQQSPSSARLVLPFLVFAVFLGLWTWKLLEPLPVPESLTRGWSLDLKFLASKALHVSAYGFLTLLAAWLPVRRRHFWVAVGVLMFHGCLTEYLQYAMDVGRTGKVSDVFIDWLGIALGLAFLRVLGIGRLSGSDPR